MIENVYNATLIHTYPYKINSINIMDCSKGDNLEIMKKKALNLRTRCVGEGIITFLLKAVLLSKDRSQGL